MVMDVPIKLEVKVENDGECAINEDEATPLRESAGDSPPHAFATGVPMSGSGWDSDPEDSGQRSAPPTPGSHLENNLEAIEWKAKPTFKIDPDQQMLDDILNDPFLCETPKPCDVNSNSKLELSDEQGSRNRDGLPCDFTNRESLEDMDLCSLEASKDLVPENQHGASQLNKPEEGAESENDADLVAQKKEILKKLANVNGKEKKKKHKKDRSHRSNRDEEESKKRKRNDSSQDEIPEEKRRSNGKHRGRKHRVKTEQPEEELDYVPVRDDEKHIRMVQASTLYERQPQQAEPNTENFSKADKRNLAVARAELVLELFQKKANEEKVDEYHMVDTVCKLPINESFRNQSCFENPSPICNNMNVVYEFNSTPGTKIDLAKWGLEVVPRATGELLRLLGIDVARLKQIQSTTKPSQRILKLKQEQLEQGLAPAVEIETATLYKNAATQTERRTATHDAGIQVRLETPFKGAFWQDSKFNQTNLTQQQSNVMYALQELCKTLPDSTVAMTLYKALEPALAIKRTASRY